MPLAFQLTEETQQAIGPAVLDNLARTYGAWLPGQAECEIGLTDLEGIRTLNDQYRGIDQPTDVLSFPTFSTLDEIRSQTGPVLIGAIAICPEKVAAYEESLPQMVHHGLLHLLGYDHEADFPVWQEAEARALADLAGQGLILPPVDSDTHL